MPRRFDLAGAAILALALGLIAWALSQIGPDTAGAADLSPLIVAGFGVVALACYALWERASAHPMTPPRLLGNRAFVGLNAATLLIYSGLAIMFFLLSFDLIDRRALPPTQAGLVFLPFTLGLGLLSRLFGGMADKTGARSMLIIGPLGAALAFLWLALGKDASLVSGVLAPMALLGVSFAIVVAPLTALVMSSVSNTDGGLASGINNDMSRIAQLAGIALAAGLASYASGYRAGMIAAAVLAAAGAAVMAAAVPHAGPANPRPTAELRNQRLRLVMRQRLHRVGIEEFDHAVAVGDQLFLAQLLHHAVEMGHAQAQHVGDHFLRERQREARLLGASDRPEAGVQFKQKMRQPFDRRAAADVDDVLGIGGRLLHGDPGQRQAELRMPVAKLDVSIERADVHAQIGDGGDRIDRALVEAAGQADDVAGQDDVEDLPLAVAQQLVAHGVAVLHEAELAVFVAVGDQIAPFADHQFAVDDVVEALEIGGLEIDKLRQPRDERMLIQRIA